MKTRFVVVKEHTLGFITPEQPDIIQNLSTSVIRGATFGSEYDTIHKPWPKHRPATKGDFDTFRVSTEGYSKDPRYDFPVK